MIWVVVAIVLGVVVVVACALVTSPLAEQTDPAMVWEGRVAVGFAALVGVGPFWVGQGVATLLATFTGDRVGPGWLWVWFVVAPLLGASPPAAALARATRRTLRRRSPSTYSPRSAAAVQQEANFAWAATKADPEWELRRTPPMPESWPPSTGGAAIWFCYAERADVAGVVEVTAPWARITLACGESAWPSVDRLADAVEVFGTQAPSPADERKPSRPGAVLEAVHNGDASNLAKALQHWRSRNAVIAGHPTLARHLPTGDATR